MKLLRLKRILFNAYLSFPGSQYFFLLIKKMGIPSYRWRKYFRFSGRFKLLVDNIELELMSYGNTIENELFWLGSKGWEYYSIKIWKKLSERSFVIFDIGANTGLYSLVAAKANESAKIYAFEPISNVLSRLQLNLKLNHVHANTFKFALADENGEGKIFSADTISGTFDQASLNEDKYKGREVGYSIIEKKKLSNFIEEHNIQRIDLIKIDVEAFEPQVLKGMGEYLKTFAPTILIEILNNQVARQVELLIEGIGYRYYLIDEKSGCSPADTLSPNKRGNNFLLLNRSLHGDVKFS